MKWLDLTLPSPAANLACDEALLDACDQGTGGEVLRFWEPSEYFVVVGFSNKFALEADEAVCKKESVGIYRRCSGGGTVLQGPGCLNYTLVLKIDGNDAIGNITAANCHIMGRHRDALSALLSKPVRIEGHTDLALDGLKFSGNAQRRKRHALVFHGTFLLNFNLALIAKFLPMPSRQPDYRKARPHELFLTNLPVSAAAVKEALRRAWSAETNLEKWPDCQELVASKYSQDDWNRRI
jgi:lipoate-protein ligase A